MAQRFRLLEQMRVERDRHEAEITAPLKRELTAAVSNIRSLCAHIEQIERTLGSDIGKVALDAIEHDIANRLMREAYDAVDRAGLASHPHRLMLARGALEEFRQQMRPAVRLDAKPQEAITIVDIRIPSLGVRRAVYG